MKKPELHTCAKVLVVEGYGDLVFYAEFLGKLGLHEGVFIKDMGGREKLMVELDTFITSPLLATKTHIAVILDSDDSSADFADRLKDTLDLITRRSLNEGEWATGGLDAKIGFFIAPRPGESGEIEDLVWKSIADNPARATEARCVEDFLVCMNAGVTATHTRIAKRKLGSWLAVHHEDDPRLGPAARDGKIDFDASALSRLKTFLQGFGEA